MKVINTSGKILYRETQQFRQWWLWAIIILSTLPTMIITSVTLPHDKAMSAGGKVAVISLIAGIALINLAILYFTKLETVISDEGFYYRWRPFRKKYVVLSWKEVAAVTIKKYPYLKYGYHTRPRFGKVSNVDGNKGALFTMNNGKHYYIGTQKLKSFQYTLEQIRPVIVELK
jgi:hypothetical protein